jgi:hypothetical protein
MIEIAGILHEYKLLNKIQGRCYVCNEISECEIEKHTKSYHILYIPIRRIEIQFIFSWAKCGHEAVLHEERDVQRYIEEQVNTGNLNIPFYFDMKPFLTVKQQYYKPNFIIVLIICVIFAAIFACIISLLRVRYVIF